MEISYTQKAKNDLTKIHWKTRNYIITHLAKYQATTKKVQTGFKPLTNTEFLKLDFNDYIAISKLEKNQINILTVVEKKKLKLPE
jgi:hypothetical protein